jgi:hypothetical protein
MSRATVKGYRMRGTWRRSRRGKPTPALSASLPALALGAGQICRFPPGGAWIIWRAATKLPGADVDLRPYGASAQSVSRRHVRIRQTSTGFTIEDLGSHNEASLNGERLSPGQIYPLASGDRLALGELRSVSLCAR